jgi:hypothetical protein
MKAAVRVLRPPPQIPYPIAAYFSTAESAEPYVARPPIPATPDATGGPFAKKKTKIGWGTQLSISH